MGSGSEGEELAGKFESATKTRTSAAMSIDKSSVKTRHERWHDNWYAAILWRHENFYLLGELKNFSRQFFLFVATSGAVKLFFLITFVFTGVVSSTLSNFLNISRNSNAWYILFLSISLFEVCQRGTKCDIVIIACRLNLLHGKNLACYWTVSSKSRLELYSIDV